MDDNNDIRLTLGAIHNVTRELPGQLDALARLVERHGERLDDIGAVAAQAARLTQLVDDLEGFLAQVPDLLRELGKNPMLSMFLAEPAEQMAGQFETFFAARRAGRTAPPAIEHTP